MMQRFCSHCDSLLVSGRCVNRCGWGKRAKEIIATREKVLQEQSAKSIIINVKPPAMSTICEELKMKKEAARFNEGKPRLSYFRRSFRKMVEGIAWVKTFGANKYEEDNWRIGGKPDSEYHDSMDRHMDLFIGGEVYDQDSGCHHLAHVCWNLCAILELNYPDVPMRDPEIYNKQMAYWAEKKKEREV